MVVSCTILIILISLVPTTDADTMIVVPENNETNITPLAFGNLTTSYEVPIDMSVSNTGSTYVVSVDTRWELIRGPAPASFIAWDSNGSILWSKRFTTWQRILFGVETDATNVFVTGVEHSNLFLGKYDQQGNNVWNITWDLGGSEWGLDISISEDGTIVVGGSTYNTSTDYFIAAFDPSGQVLWHKILQNHPTPICSSTFIYVICDGVLQKYQTDGVLIWSANYNEGRQVYTNGEILYTPEEKESYQDLPGIPGTFQEASVKLSKWNALTGEQFWTQNYGLYDTDHQLYNSSGIDYAITHDGSLMFLINVFELGRWYLQSVSQNRKVVSKTYLLDSAWYTAIFAVGESGVIHVAGYGRNGLAVALYDPSQLTPYFDSTTYGDDYQIVGIVAVGVILFDTGLIIFLKKKYSSSRMRS